MTRRKPTASKAGVTLIETLVAAVLLATFFASVCELNAICLRYIDASKESVSALQAIYDRVEVLRNTAFRDLSDPSYVQTLLGPAPNDSDFCKKATEVVKIRAYPTANGITQFTRSPNGTVSINSTAIDLGSSHVQVDVSTSWRMTLNSRNRSEESTTIISNGTKK
jgi:Tfp pilus assembly protein PilV